MPERARLGERRLLRRVRQAHRQEVSARPGPHGRQAPWPRSGRPGGGFGQRVPEVRRGEPRTALLRLRLPLLGPPAVRPPGRAGVVLLVRHDRALPLAALALRPIPTLEVVLPNRAVPLPGVVLPKWPIPVLGAVFVLGIVPVPGALLLRIVPLSGAVLLRAALVLRSAPTLEAVLLNGAVPLFRALLLGPAVVLRAAPALGGVLPC